LSLPAFRRNEGAIHEITRKSVSVRVASCAFMDRDAETRSARILVKNTNLGLCCGGEVLSSGRVVRMKSTRSKTRYNLLSGSTHELKDTKEFIESIGESVAVLPNGWRDFFSSEPDLIVTRAPGRLDLMGGIADYSGSLVLQLPIENAVHVAWQRTEENRLRIASLPDGSVGPLRLFKIDLSELLTMDYASAREWFASQPENHWAAYVAGALLVLRREKGLQLNQGADILVSSKVPEGKGVSSSAALEVAVMQAVAAASRIDLSAPELALLCQRVENQIVGAPCGVMDQMTAACGERNRLLELLCQPAELKGNIELPGELQVWGIDSGVRHSVAGSDYRRVRTAAFMGYRIIAAAAGLKVISGESAGQIIIDDPKWKGYLANITPAEFEGEYAAHVPEQMTGADFLGRYEGITDEATAVDPEVSYPVAAATSHPIHEHFRVRRFAEILKQWRGIEQAAQLGDLMWRSHDSYSRCGLGTDETDTIVALARESDRGELFGAKITGGGSGGTVAVLGCRGADKAIERLVRQYQQETGHRATIISGSSPGAVAFGKINLRPTSEGASL
jgi:galactokinase